MIIPQKIMFKLSFTNRYIIFIALIIFCIFLEYKYFIFCIFAILFFGIIFIFVPMQKQLKIQHNILIQQSKMASMGEMIENIVHQWKQPLNAISNNASCLMIEKQMDILKDSEFDKKLNDIILKTQFLSQTIDDFKDFFKPTRIKVETNIAKIIEDALQIFNNILYINSIELYKNYDTNIKIYYKCFANELIQVLINIFNNAKDALVENNVENKIIRIKLFQTNDNIIIQICDNGGGIPKDIISKIFQPYFTTKNKNGTGIGLYMSHKIITEHFNGILKVTNQNLIFNNNTYYGACFEIILPCNDN
jgi:signal transduction histidine kinase